MLPSKINAMGNCAHCNRELTTLSSVVNARFIMLHSLIDLMQGRIRGGKAGSAVLKYHLDSAAWVLPGKINAMRGCVRCNWGLPLLSGDLNLIFFVLSVSLTAGKAVFVGGKRRE